MLRQNVGRRLYAERFDRVQRCFKTKFVYLRVRENTRHIIENSWEAKAEKSLIATWKTTQIPFIYRTIFCESFWVVEIDHISSLFSTLELLYKISHFGFGYQYWFRSLYNTPVIWVKMLQFISNKMTHSTLTWVKRIIIQ